MRTCRSALTGSLVSPFEYDQRKRYSNAFPPAPPKATSWGAIAYSVADMGAGWSMGKSDRASAEKGRDDSRPGSLITHRR